MTLNLRQGNSRCRIELSLGADHSGGSIRIAVAAVGEPWHTGTVLSGSGWSEDSIVALCVLADQLTGLPISAAVREVL